MTQAITIKNDFGEVQIDDPARDAIHMIQDMAYSLQIEPSEFIEIFDNGIPLCPHCQKKGLHQH